MSNQRQFIYKPREIILDKRLTPVEQDYLCLIAALQNAKDCTASNNWFATYFGVKRQTAQEIIGRLKGKNIIACKEQKQGSKTIKRTIEIVDSSSRKLLLMNSDKVSRKRLPTKAVFDSSGLAGNSDKVSRKLPTHKTKVKTNTATAAHIPQKPLYDIPPTIKQVRAYSFTRGFPDFDAKHFVEWYAAADWRHKDGKPVLNWKQTVLTWLRRDQAKEQQAQAAKPAPKRGDLDWLPDEQEAEVIMKDVGL
jgi:hypothetical protein